MPIGAILGVGSSLIGAASANRAADAQTDAANNELALRERIYDETTQRFEPFLREGRNYAEVRNFLDGIGPRPTIGGTAPQITEEQYRMEPTGWRAAIGGEGGEAYANSLRYGPEQRGTRYLVNGQTFDTRDAAQAYANNNLTGGTPYEGMQATDAYRFRVNEGVRAIDAGAAARG
ncbi:MAG: hypothetical protein ACPG61_19115, partial [Paracoccaceae bacterium]